MRNRNPKARGLSNEWERPACQHIGQTRRLEPVWVWGSCPLGLCSTSVWHHGSASLHVLPSVSGCCFIGAKSGCLGSRSCNLMSTIQKKHVSQNFQNSVSSTLGTETKSTSEQSPGPSMRRNADVLPAKKQDQLLEITGNRLPQNHMGCWWQEAGLNRC